MVAGLEPIRVKPWLMAAAAVLLLVVGVWRFTRTTDSARGPVALASAGTSYDVAAEAETLHFDDGTQIVLMPATRAELGRVDARGASVVLTRGSLHAKVTPRPDAHWLFHAAGFRVEVTGTAFDLRLSGSELTLAMHEGSVRVTGPGLSTARSVVAGETVVFGTQTTAPSTTSLPAAPAPTSTPISTPVSSAHPLSSAAASTNDWQALAAKGKHKEAFEEVAPRLEGELQARDAATLMRLATVSRLSGRSDVAQRIYTTIRERFPNTVSAASAAFSLGTMAFNTQPGTATNWFSTYLAEAPGGPLASAARGRLLELAIRAGNGRAAASTYLQYHPHGPHADLARKTLAADSGAP